MPCPIHVLYLVQIANYGIGGHYDLHQDPMFLYKDSDYMARLGEGNDESSGYITGDRMSTFMIYLNDVKIKYFLFC